jgi:hypothetical protein
VSTAAIEAELSQAFKAGAWDRVEALARALDSHQRTAPAPTVLGAALWYAQAGLRVFPIQPGSKVPLPGSRGCKDASTDPERITAWWREVPNANLAIATGHLIDVLDFDGALGHRAWSQAFTDPAAPWGHEPDGAPRQPLATVSTPRPGGMHAYVPATGQGNGAGRLPGVDYRGAGGYVLAPPSVTPQGTYRFLRKLNPEDLRDRDTPRR